jgi:hypothetical protein
MDFIGQLHGQLGCLQPDRRSAVTERSDDSLHQTILPDLRIPMLRDPLLPEPCKISAFSVAKMVRGLVRKGLGLLLGSHGEEIPNRNPRRPGSTNTEIGERNIDLDI